MDSQNDPSVSPASRKRHYSTIGIHDVFLSPVALKQLPRNYYNNTSGSSRSFVSPEIVGTVKAEPEDFIVRELACKKLGLSPEWRVADLRTAGPSETAISETATIDSTPAVSSSITLKQEEAASLSQVIKEGLHLEKELAPLEVVQRVLQTRHPETFEEELLALQNLQEQALQILKEHALVSASKSQATKNILWIPPIPVYVSCLSSAKAASTKRLLGGGDRGSLHRCLKQAFPFLQSESKKRENSSDADPWIRVEVDESFFELAPYVYSPAHERIRSMYQFRNRGVPSSSATQVMNKNGGDASRMKRKRSSDRNSGYSEDDPFLLPLRSGLSKDERRKVHHLISGRTRDFQTRTISDYCLTPHATADDSATGETTNALALNWSKNAKRAVCKSSRSKSCSLFVLKKRQKEHLTAIQLLTRALHCRQSDIGMAGIKDMHAVTYQYFTLRGQKSDRVVVSKANDALVDLEMEIVPVRQVEHFLQPGDLEGNHFEIIVRNIKRIQAKVGNDSVEEERISCDREHILARSEAVRKCGFVNFYGEQRVGIAGDTDVVGVRSFDIGRAMLQRDFDKAIDLLMTGRLICRGLNEQENPQARKVRQVWKETGGNVDETYKALPKGDSLARERTVLQGLKRYQSSLEALKCLHFQVRTFWINAYQSYIWNKMASERIESYGSKVVIGDLLRGGDGEIVVVTADLVATAQFSEVVLPLPGYNVQYPTNDMGRRYEELLLEENVQFEKDAPLEATAKGSYRRLVVEMDSLQVAFPEPCRIDAADSFRISFDLPSGSYATMFLRELMVTTVSRM